ncbi:MAG TPA: molybdopterin-dependent oxidoreductase, partial [Burkholderiaceae bacterium]|nr:molybdopterin-dependent oxidoreductase [Burkholderiaceae bacterium]
YNSNPVAVVPQSREVARGFAREDLFTVVLEHFLTDTADYADYVLPATTQLEHVDVHKSYGHLYMLANNAAIEPLGEALPNSEIFRRFAAKMGFDEPCFSETDDQLAAQAFKRQGATSGFDWSRLKERGWQRLDMPEQYAPFAEGGFATPSGKCEFYSEQLAKLGQDPVPAYLAPYEAPDGGPDADRYPLAMISPPARNFLNSTFVNVTSLRSTDGEPTVEIHPDDARARRIADGTRVRIFNDRGSINVLACVTDRARPGCVVALSIWWKKLARDGKNANELTSPALTDIGRAPTFYDCLVQVGPVHPENVSAKAGLRVQC